MKILYFIVLILGVSLISCNSNEKKTNANQEENLESTEESSVSLTDFDLRPYEINAKIKVPTADIVSVHHQLDSFDWDLLLGKQSYVMIQDWGTENGFEAHLKALEEENADIEYIEQEEAFLLYKSTVGASKISYHAVAQYEIEGINYLFLSSKIGFPHDKMDRVVASIKSVKAH